MCVRLISCLLVGALAAGLPAQKPDAIEDVFPATSFGIVQFGGLRACSEAAGELGLVTLGRQTLERVDPEIYEQYVGRQLSQAVPQMRRQLMRMGIKPEALRAVLQNPIGLGVGRLTFFGGQPVPSIALAMDVSGSEQEAEELLAVAERMLRRAVGEVDVDVGNIDGTSVRMLTSAQHSGVIASARVGSFLLVTNSMGYMRECLATCRGEQPSIGAEAGYRRARAKLGTQPLLAGYMNAKPLLAAPRPLMPYEVAQVCDALGLSDMDGAFAGVGIGEGGSIDVMHLGIQGPPDGLLRAALGRPVSFEHAALCPPDTLAYAAMSVDSAAIPGACRRLFESLPVEARRELEREVLREVSRELRHMEMSLEDVAGLVGLFGPEMTVAVTRPASGIPELLAFVDVADMRAAEDILMGTLEQERVPMNERTHKGTLIRFSQAFKGSAVPYSPAFALHDKKLIIGSSFRVVRDTLNRLERGRPGLDAAEDFKRHMKAASGSTAFACLRLSDTATQLWSMAEPWVEKLLWEQAELDIDVLPSSEELAESITDSVVTMRVDESGITCREQHPVGGGAIVAVAGLLIDELLGRAAPEGASTPKKGKIY